MPKPLHVAICGAGPAGLSAALALHAGGHRISIFDQFERPRALGSGLILQPAGLAVLDWLGLGDRMRGLGARIDRLYGKACSTDRVVLDVRYAALGEARGLAASLEESHNLQAAIEAYARRRRFHVKLYQAMSRVFTQFYQSDSTFLPMLRDYIVAPLSRFPPAQRLLAGIVSGQFGLPKDR